MNGTEFGKILRAGNLSGIARELAILSAAKNSIAPNAGGGGMWSFVYSQATLAGKARTLVMQCAPLPFSIGTLADPFLCPAWPWTYQAIANDIDAVLPTRKMCLLADKAATIRIDPKPFPLTNGEGKPDGGLYNESSDRYVQSNGAILAELQKIGQFPPSGIVAGAKKDVVLGPALDGSKVAIFGWFFKIGNSADNKDNRWQPYSTIHPGDYVDYSHGWRVFRRYAKLDGEVVDLNDIATDKLLHVLISDQGPFPLTFPNTANPVPPPPGYPPGTFAKGGGLAVQEKSRARAVGGAVIGGTVGFALGGPVGALVGAALGGALGRA